MPTSIAREEVQRLLRDEGALVIEVLPTTEYQDEHIDGAINIPLKTLDYESTGGLDKARPLIVYWHDAAWDMSPRAAWRLETLGFTNVYDYVAGKLASIPRAGDVARRDDVTCQLTDQIGDVINKVRAAGKDTCTHAL